MANNNFATNPDGGFNKNTPDIIRGVIRNDFLEVKNSLIDNPSCINFQDQLGRTASMYAILGSNLDMFIWLSKRKDFNPLIEDYEFHNLLYFAFWAGDKEIIDYVFKFLYPLEQCS